MSDLRKISASTIFWILLLGGGCAGAGGGSDRIPADNEVAAWNQGRLIKMAQRMELRDFLDLCATFQGISHNTADHAESIAAFLEKRPGTYRGR